MLPCKRAPNAAGCPPYLSRHCILASRRGSPRSLTLSRVPRRQRYFDSPSLRFLPAFLLKVALGGRGRMSFERPSLGPFAGDRPIPVFDILAIILAFLCSGAMLAGLPLDILFGLVQFFILLLRMPFCSLCLGVSGLLDRGRGVFHFTGSIERQKVLITRPSLISGGSPMRKAATCACLSIVQSSTSEYGLAAFPAMHFVRSGV